MSLSLLFGACSVNSYRPAQPIEQPIERAAPAPADEVAEATPPPEPLVPDDSPSSPSVAPGAPAIATPGDSFILERVALTARRMVGVPYHYGGTDPRGFDCSGLVFYAYRKAGAPVARTSREQLRASQPLDVEDALPGDLVFFRTGKRAWHVGIYLGDQHFIHAPSTGRAVAIERLDDEYYLRHRIQIRRLDALK
jgi:cell wall-associated NlpC family hydrolase